MPYADPEAKRARDREYGLAHRAEGRERQRQFKARNPERQAEYSAKWKYGITPDEYDRLFAEQDGRCAICREPETTKDRTGRVRARLSIDHDHETGRIRGLLCHHCNAALGHAKESSFRLRDMAAYLERAAR